MINWQYCKNPNDINEVFETNDEELKDDWMGLRDASQIISITFDTNHMCYVVFWRM